MYERMLTGFGLWDPVDVKKFPRFMVIAEEAELKMKPVTDGVTGRVKKHLAASTVEITTQVAELQKEMKEMKQQDAKDRSMAEAARRDEAAARGDEAAHDGPGEAASRGDQTASRGTCRAARHPRGVRPYFHNCVCIVCSTCRD